MSCSISNKKAINRTTRVPSLVDSFRDKSGTKDLRSVDIGFAALYSQSMVRLSVMYPAAPASTFDWNYYLGPHLVLARQLLVPRGLVRIEVDRGIGAFPPGTPSHYHAIGHLYFETMLDLDTALAATAPDLIADQRKYYSGNSVVQVSEVVPV
jgi:uncharacterized protein (TIGR02118 family)